MCGEGSRAYRENFVSFSMHLYAFVPYAHVCTFVLSVCTVESVKFNGQPNVACTWYCDE